MLIKGLMKKASLEPKKIYELAKEFLQDKKYVRSYPRCSKSQICNFAFILAQVAIAVM